MDSWSHAPVWCTRTNESPSEPSFDHTRCLRELNTYSRYCYQWTVLRTCQFHYIYPNSIDPAQVIGEYKHCQKSIPPGVLIADIILGSITTNTSSIISFSAHLPEPLATLVLGMDLEMRHVLTKIHEVVVL
jgi:hypothetical protein